MQQLGLPALSTNGPARELQCAPLRRMEKEVEDRYDKWATDASGNSNLSFLFLT